MGLFGHRPPANGATPASQGDPRNRVFGDGSLGGIAGGIGKILTYGPFLGVAQEGMNRRRQLEDSNMQYKAAMAAHAMQPDQSAFQKTYEYMKSINPAMADTYLRSQANPQTLMTDPATGNVRFAPKAGPDPQAPVTKQLPDGSTAYWVNGAWYDNSEGKE